MAKETRTARLTILIDPNKKAVFEDLCRLEDMTPSQIVRRLIRSYIEGKLGRPWKPGEHPAVSAPPRRAADAVPKSAKSARRPANSGRRAP